MRLALWPGLLALLAYALAALLPQRAGAAVRASLVVAWCVHALSIAVDVSGAGSAGGGTRFGFAPALSMTLWLVIAVYLIESRWLPLTGVRRSLAALGLIAVALALLFPGEIRPQMVSPWEPLHVVTAIAAYGLFGAAVLHAAMLDRADRQMRDLPQRSMAMAAGGGLPLLRLERLTFRFVAAGFVLLSATLLVGWSVAPWHWNHKTVFSLLAWVVFATLLAGRRAFGWRGPRATRWLYAGTGLLLLAYIGSRFVFEVVLHRPPSV
ncbi:MAG: cytochrome C assembly protein [Betaproteobacteria bacterium]|nr:MAG: cytochrome C assembly protein [Betaproteobacteria bacterium]TMH34929.1 MAG: cytochrome C assembly protein [Betaproteobacteria bacterium]